MPQVVNSYNTILKVIGLIIFIPLGLGFAVFLGFVGFGIDLGNALSADGSGSMYMFLLPFGFMAVTGWVIYAFSKRRALLAAEEQKTEIRKQVYREQNLGTNNNEVVINILANKGSRTAVEISVLLGISQEQTLEVIRELLQSGRIRQDAKKNPARFYL